MPQLVRDRNLGVGREASWRIGDGIVVLPFSHEHDRLLLPHGTDPPGLCPNTRIPRASKKKPSAKQSIEPTLGTRGARSGTFGVNIHNAVAARRVSAPDGQRSRLPRYGPPKAGSAIGVPTAAGAAGREIERG
jgi:hypothetical protein